MEVESRSDTLPLLDCATHKGGGKLKTNVYRKSTDGGAALNYSLAHSKVVYASMVSSMFNKARLLCTEEVYRRAAQLELKKQLQDFAYTAWKLCNDCTNVYIGQTAGELHNRIGEHKRSTDRPLRNVDEYQLIAEDLAVAGHVLNTKHRPRQIRLHADQHMETLSSRTLEGRPKTSRISEPGLCIPKTDWRLTISR
ncbi:hypothetical protein CLF_102066 [Clonorchis sinensis]|uniref:C2H2-type domain-containing protein n=1 Tax=Clonorchis sinensis TaxID=79923 RepID=G7Y777_CLOSI|nr:hypothetical protein CLF_102066 [Clonorchis sinensis]